MKKNKILKVIVVVMFCFIIVLVALLVYAKSELNKNGASADTSTIAQNSSAVSNIDVSKQSESSTSQVSETIELKLYVFDADNYEKEKEIRTVTVDKKLYKDDFTAAINKVFSSTDLKINKATISGKAVTIDLPKEVAFKFNSGSAGGITNTNILAATILNLPDIDELKVTVDGVAGVVADHFNFNGIFIKGENGKKYNFVESENKSKVLDF